MPSSGDGTAWDETIPSDSGEVDDTGLEMREIKKAVRIRQNKEHVAVGSSSAGGEHKKGSARGYIQTTYPTQRPDASTDLGASDDGRILLKQDGAGNAWLEYWDGTAWKKAIVADEVVSADSFEDGTISAAFSYAVYSEQMADTDTQAGTFTSGAWRTRNLDTEEVDGESIGSLSANQVTLGAGTYRVKLRAPAFQVNYHQVRLRDITNGATRALGTMALSGSGDNVMTLSVAESEFTITGNTVFEVQHRCSDTKANTGFGAGPGTFGVAWTTTVLEIWKLK